ncbi:MAG: hypothetical protein RL199_2414 [Pseudomonadota bacterium]
MRLVVDRIDGDVVLVTDGRRSFELPAALFVSLPREGDVLEVDVRPDVQETDRARSALAARRKALSSDDDGGDFGL